MGFPVTADQSAELLIGQREDSGRIFVRIGGTCARARKASKNAEIARRAKVGYCQCCTRPTHIAVPSRYVVGEFSSSKASGISLWMERGPWAARYFAASLRAQDCGRPPSTWNWAAQSIDVRGPPLVRSGLRQLGQPLGASVPRRALGSVRRHSPAVSLPSTQEEAEKTPKLKVNFSAGVARPDEDLLPRRRHPPPSRRSPSPSSLSNYMVNLSRARQEGATIPPRRRRSK